MFSVYTSDGMGVAIAGQFTVALNAMANPADGPSDAAVPVKVVPANATPYGSLSSAPDASSSSTVAALPQFAPVTMLPGTNETLAGNGSLTLTLAAVPLPGFDTRMQ